MVNCFFIFLSSAWKQYSDALDAQHDIVVSISEDLYQSVSKHSHVYHHLKGSCLEDFDVGRYTEQSSLYILPHLHVFYVHHRHMFSGRFIDCLQNIAILYRQSALRELSRNIHAMTSEVVCMYRYIFYIYSMYKQQAI